MTTDILTHYLIDGLTIEQIGLRVGRETAYVRGQLCRAGIRFRRVVCGPQQADLVNAAVKGRGYKSFHDFVLSQGVAAVHTQAGTLGVSERAFVRVYELYTQLLGQLDWAGRRIVQPAGTDPG